MCRICLGLVLDILQRPWQCTQELYEQRTNYIEGVTEEGLIGNLEALKYHLGRNWLTDERREEVY